jgi:hypothetical protein
MRQSIWVDLNFGGHAIKKLMITGGVKNANPQSVSNGNEGTMRSAV